MSKTRALFLLAGITLFLSSCTNHHKMSSETTKGALNSISYAKDESTGLCFAMISSVNSYGNIVSLTDVPCEKIGK